jgi:hypothetical protein
MIHRVTIERDTQSATNAHGHKGAPSFTTHLADQPCFLYVAALGRAGREAIAVDRSIAVRSYALLLPKGVDVIERDRVNGVVDRRGVVLLSGAMNIRAVTQHHGHVEVELEAAR